tara:strand:+ start:68 stop:211 length:144 start_codon:yes stop_codon:yes gene_type:complete
MSKRSLYKPSLVRRTKGHLFEIMIINALKEKTKEKDLTLAEKLRNKS